MTRRRQWIGAQILRLIAIAYERDWLTQKQAYRATDRLTDWMAR